MIVLDTHALVWTVAREDRRLGRKAKALIERWWSLGKVAVSAITFWEVAMLQAKRRLEVTGSVEEWRSQLLAAGLLELPVDGAIAIRSTDLTGLPADPADRLIVATALHHSAALVTADARVLAWKHPLVRHDAST